MDFINRVYFRNFNYSFYSLYDIYSNYLKIDTEIDWKAYMDEVAGAMYTSLDYTKLRGETGKIELKI